MCQDGGGSRSGPEARAFPAMGSDTSTFRMTAPPASHKERRMGARQARSASERDPIAALGANGPGPGPSTELADDEGPIPTFPSRQLDEHGRLIPLSVEERAARRAAANRTIKALRNQPDKDPPGTDE